MKKIRANVCAVTHAGRVRRENEDNYSLNGRLTSTGDLKKGSAFVQSMNERTYVKDPEHCQSMVNIQALNESKPLPDQIRSDQSLSRVRLFATPTEIL